VEGKVTFQGRTEVPLKSVTSRPELTQDEASNLRMLAIDLDRIRGNSVPEAVKQLMINR